MTAKLREPDQFCAGGLRAASWVVGRGGETPDHGPTSTQLKKHSIPTSHSAKRLVYPCCLRWSDHFPLPAGLSSPAKPAMSSVQGVPVVDVAALVASKAERDPAAVAAAVAALDRACRKWGFFHVVNHGIPEATLAAFDGKVSTGGNSVQKPRPGW